MNRSRMSMLLVYIAALLNACAGSSQSNLNGTTWTLTAYKDNPPIAGAQPTLQFENGQVSGNTGCNHYGGSYEVQGDTIRFGDLFNTEMACLEPEGVMEQEQIYLEMLRSADHFELIDGVLRIYTGSQQTLIYEEQGSSTPPEPAQNEPSVDAPTPIPEALNPTATARAEPPAGFKEYRDPPTGISIDMPKDWFVTGVIEGQFAILQSYPEDKYIGGEAREPGDTKCDLNIRAPGTSADELIQQWKSDNTSTLLSEEQIVLQSGQPGMRVELESMGRANAVITEIDGRLVVFTCFGDFTLFDEIARSISPGERTNQGE